MASLFTSGPTIETRNRQHQEEYRRLQARSTSATMTTLSASPASFATMSPCDAMDGPINPSLCLLLHQPSSTQDFSQTSPTNSPMSLPLHTQTCDRTYLSAPKHISLAPITETDISSSGLGFTPLNSTLASRVASMSQLEACAAEIALENDIHDQCERGRRSVNVHTVSLRNRALSAPEGTVNLDLQNKSLRAAQPLAKVGSSHPITDKISPFKPTPQEWASDIDCVSTVLGAMLADNDRGAR